MRTALLIVGTATTLLLATWSTGALHPRVEIQPTRASVDLAARSFNVEIELANEALLPVDILSVGEGGSGLGIGQGRVEPESSEEIPGSLPRTLQPGERLRVAVTYVEDCAAAARTSPTAIRRLQVRTRTPVGLTRTAGVDIVGGFPIPFRSHTGSPGSPPPPTLNGWIAQSCGS